MDAISKLLAPRSVAVIGASADPGKTAGRPVAYLQKHGFAGRIMPVNPKAERIGDLPCYADIASLPEVPDVALVAVPAGLTEQALRRYGITVPDTETRCSRTIWVSGFAGRRPGGARGAALRAGAAAPVPPRGSRPCAG